jgi:hypothetical protein
MKEKISQARNLCSTVINEKVVRPMVFVLMQCLERAHNLVVQAIMILEMSGACHTAPDTTSL